MGTSATLLLPECPQVRLQEVQVLLLAVIKDSSKHSQIDEVVDTMRVNVTRC